MCFECATGIVTFDLNFVLWRARLKYCTRNATLTSGKKTIIIVEKRIYTLNINLKVFISENSLIICQHIMVYGTYYVLYMAKAIIIIYDKHVYRSCQQCVVDVGRRVHSTAR